MKKNIKHYLPILLGLSLGFVSCSQMELNIEEETPETVVEEEVWTLKVEAGAKGDADTKALSMNPNGTISLNGCKTTSFLLINTKTMECSIFRNRLVR